MSCSDLAVNNHIIKVIFNTLYATYNLVESIFWNAEGGAEIRNILIYIGADLHMLQNQLDYMNQDAVITDVQNKDQSDWNI